MTLEILVHGCRQAKKCDSVKPFNGTPAPILLIIVYTCSYIATLLLS